MKLLLWQQQQQLLLRPPNKLATRQPGRVRVLVLAPVLALALALRREPGRKSSPTQALARHHRRQSCPAKWLPCCSRLRLSWRASCLQEALLECRRR